MRGVANLRTKEYKAQLAAEGYPADFTRRSYMRYQIKKLLVSDVEWQYEALSQVVRLRCTSPASHYATTQHPFPAADRIMACMSYALETQLSSPCFKELQCHCLRYSVQEFEG